MPRLMNIFERHAKTGKTKLIHSLPNKQLLDFATVGAFADSDVTLAQIMNFF